MNQRLERLLAELQAEPVATHLNAIEPIVWQRIAGKGLAASVMGGLRWRVTAIGMALGIGVAFGGAASARPDQAEMAVFSPQASLAPSTLLDATL